MIKKILTHIAIAFMFVALCGTVPVAAQSFLWQEIDFEYQNGKNRTDTVGDTLISTNADTVYFGLPVPTGVGDRRMALYPIELDIGIETVNINNADSVTSRLDKSEFADAWTTGTLDTIVVATNAAVFGTRVHTFGSSDVPAGQYRFILTHLGASTDSTSYRLKLRVKYQR